MQKRKSSSANAVSKAGVASPTNYSKLALSSSAVSSRKNSDGSPLAMAYGSPSKHGQQRRSLGVSNSSFHAEVPNEVDRALQMLYTYPIMKVAGTAFENNTYNQQPQQQGAGAAADEAAAGGASTSVKEDRNNLAHRESYASVSGEVMDHVIKESFNEDGSSRGVQKPRDGMVRLAHALKQAAMWQTILVTVLSQESLTASFRSLKLRQALERHLLPTLMKRKEETGSVLNKNYVRARDAAALQEEKVEKPAEGGFLKENHNFFQNLNNTSLLQSIADCMTRVRFSSGEIVARPEDPSQQAMYFLVSGKCEMRRDEITADGEGVSTTTKVLQPGDALGGIFGTNAVYGATYRALSVCSMWKLRTEDFESVFRPFADKAMIAMYVDALREHATEWLASRYPIATLLPRMPIYRYLSNSSPKNQYTDGMEPIVKLRGDVLFNEGDPLGDVYCLLDGHVQRAVRGLNGSYATGVSQVLALSDFFTFGRSGRFILLGEEPHILPGVQRYRCLVASRVALLVRIPKDSFINALLDDPTYLIQLREKLQQTYKSEMKFDPVCLSYVPLLKDFPESSRQALAKEAVPLVAGRSVSLCEPAQHVKEIYLLTMGDVRDTRTYGHQPTARLPASTTTEGAAADDDHKVEMGRKTHLAATAAAAADAAMANPKYKGVGSFARRRQSTMSMSIDPADRPMEWSFDFHDNVGDAAAKQPTSAAKGGDAGADGQPGTINPTGGTATALAASAKPSYTLVNPEEQQELNPPLPLPPAKTFSVTLGGSWEGLLVDKWPYGWETTSTVTAWALPTAKIRSEYNSLPKSLQTSVLQYVRQRQKEELGLPALSTEKLPPMTSYGGDAKALAVAMSGAAGKDDKRTVRRSVGRSIDGDVNVGRNSMSLSNEVEYTSQQFNSEGVSESARVSSALAKRGTTGGAGAKPFTVASPKKEASKKNAGASAQKSDKDVKKKTKKAAREKAEEEAEVPPAPKEPKATLPHFHYSKATRDKAKSTTNNDDDDAPPSEVSPHLLAIYNGEFKNDDPAVINIVRDPALPPAGSRKQASTVPGGSPPRGDAAATQWPASGAGKKRWFTDVPSYEPLPGTTQNDNMNVEVPTFNSNTTYMTKRTGKAYKENLMNTTNYQAAANEGRKEEDTSYVQSHSSVAKRMRK